VDVLKRYSRSPHAAPPAEDPADEFLRLACLTYSDDDPARWAAARTTLAERPELARASLHAAAAAGDVEAARQHLADVDALGGPHRWEPLLYLAYSRAAGPGALEVARLLLDAGADVDAGFLWDGLSPPFTALTGAFGRGEGDPPPHRDALPLARMLLEAGADPNDAQAVYNRSFTPEDEWLSLLIAFGFGHGDGGPWHARLGSAHATPRENAEDCLMWAAHHGHPHRVELLVAAGVDPDGRGTRHPLLKGRTALEVALLHGHGEVAGTLREAGAREPRLTAEERVEAAYMRADATVQAPPPPGLIVRAAEYGRADVIALLVDRGADVNAFSGRATALHEAALRGNRELVDVLLAAGADPALHDREFDATPAGWADHAGHTTLAEFLKRTPTAAPRRSSPR
jgi:ankyrin repeat protein